MASFGITLSPSLMRRKVESIIIHENYAAHKHDDDIAVVKLFSPIIFSNEVHRVCLPEATSEALSKSKVFVTGWGALKLDGEYLSKTTKQKNINLSFIWTRIWNKIQNQKNKRWNQMSHDKYGKNKQIRNRCDEFQKL